MLGKHILLLGSEVGGRHVGKEQVGDNSVDVGDEGEGSPRSSVEN